MNTNKAFTIVELIIVSSIALILITMSLSTFVQVSDNQALEKDVNHVVAFIEKARTQTINSKNASQYSIRFASSTVTLFSGVTYVAGASSNSVLDLSSKVEISAISLTGGVQQVSFEYITGKSNATGTIRFRLKQNPNASSTIMLYKTGLAEVI